MRSTKKSLIMSTISLILCFAMLLGSTWAWFTDEVTSGKNKIVAGNLDVELVHTDKGGSSEVKADTKLFDDVALWEPGAYAYETFTVKNVGNLAFKYSMQINATNATVVNGHSLDEVLKVAVVESAPTSRQTYSDAVSLQEWSLESKDKPLYPANNKPDGGNSEESFTVVVYWEPTDHDNDYNMNNGNKGKELSVDLGIQLVATQLSYEKDSFDEKYDKTASYSVSLPKMTEKFPENSTEELTIEKTGIIEEAKVPAKAANAVFDALSAEAPAAFKDGDNLKSGVSQELVLTLDVEDKGAKTNTQTFNIDMTAVMTFTEGANTETVTKNVTNLNEFVYVDVQVAKDLTLDGVKHNDKDMTNLANIENHEPDGTNDDNGYYNYKATEGLLRLIMKSFSPFTMTWQELQNVTPTSTPVSGTISGTQGSFSNGKYETVLATSGATTGLHFLTVVFNNVNHGDILYLTFDETPTVGEDVGSPNEWKTFIQIDGTNITPTDKTAKVVLNDTSHILQIMQTKANKVSIKIDHQELPVIVEQPTAANPMVAATGEDLHYQWYKTESVVIDANSNNAVYGTATKGKYENQLWSTTDNYCLYINLKGVNKGDIVTFKVTQGTATYGGLEDAAGKIDYIENENTQQEYSFQIPTDAGEFLVLIECAKDNSISGTLSLENTNSVKDGTGPKLETTESGTYFCKVSNRVGTVISDKVTIN